MNSKPKLNYTRIGERIQTKRKNMGLTQSQVAEQSGLSAQYMANIENGSTQTIGLKALFSISNVLGVGTDYFLVDSIEHNKEVINKEIETMLEDMTKNQRIIAMDMLNVIYNNPKMFETIDIDEYEEDDDEKY